MSKELEDKKEFARFKKPTTLTVDQKQWEYNCDELRKKAAIGTFIFIAISAVVSIFTFGILVFVLAMGVAVFINVSIRKKFNELKSLDNHRYTISSSQIIEEVAGKKQIIPFSKIQEIDFQNWGIEIDTKKNRKASDKSEGLIKIPNAVNDFGRVIATFKHLEKG